jgi:transcriptional regulator with XRE-family HTH domain
MPRSTRRGGRSYRKADTPHPVDVHVGTRVRLRRIELGITQAKLAAELGLTFQQVYKYERAANRISASQLFHIGKVLGVKVASFYEGYEEAGAPSGFAQPPAEAFRSDPMQRRDTIELLCNAFYAIDDAALRRRLLDLAKTLAGGDEPK